MRILFVTDSFSKQMGYSSNCLPQAMARQGVEVHQFCTQLFPYQESIPSAQVKGVYDKFSESETRVEGSVEDYEGTQLHTLRHKRLLGHPCFIGLDEKVKSVAPDIVQSYSCIGWVPLQAARAAKSQNSLFYTEAHMHRSLHRIAGKKISPFSLLFARSLAVRLSGKWINNLSVRCYPTMKDCEEIAVEYYGVSPSKSKIQSLGVDTARFIPNDFGKREEEAQKLRLSLGIKDDELVAIYTGRFTENKLTPLLAQAVEELADSGKKIRALFVGEGIERTKLEKYKHSIVHEFVNHRRLPDFYRAADFAVWPALESMSILDAQACGLPVIGSDVIGEPKYVENGGIFYQCGDLLDLKQKILQLADPETRAVLAEKGVNKINENYSWDKIAADRLNDFEQDLNIG